MAEFFDGVDDIDEVVVMSRLTNYGACEPTINNANNFNHNHKRHKSCHITPRECPSPNLKDH
jgi:hypothetical protein